MRKVISHLFLTLDGVAQLESIHGLVMSRMSDELNSDTHRRLAEEDAMILGRSTYQQWAPFWPTSTRPYAAHINVVPKYVASRTLDPGEPSLPWGNHEPAQLLLGSLPESIRQLTNQPGGNIGVHGSPTLVAAMLEANLIDELRLAIFPILAGTGPRLFPDHGAPQQLTLVDSKVTTSGVAILTYQVGRPRAAD